MTSPLHIARGLEACTTSDTSPPETTTTNNTILISPTRMRPLLSCSTRTTLPLTGLLWLALAAYLAQAAWAWGPADHHGGGGGGDDDAWYSHHGPKHAELMYRAVYPRINGTAAGEATHATGAMPLSTSRPSSPSSVTNSSLDTSCGATAPLFNIQVAQASGDNDSGIFNGWWLKLSGDMVLFTSQKEKATGFGLNQGTSHLCVPQTGSLPLIAILETRLETSPLYFLDSNFSRGYQPEYEPIACDILGGNGSQLSCAQDTRTSWMGCGLQLELGIESSSNGTKGGSGCSSVSLYVFQS